MVCLGNICRFPLLESILKSKLPKKTFEVESAGTEGFHIGKYTDPRSIEIVAQNGINISLNKLSENLSVKISNDLTESM